MRSFLNLGKAGISFSVALTTATGYLLSTGKIDFSVLFPYSGVLFLAMAASALNQIQEVKTDSLMQRTANRPLVNKQLSLQTAVLFTIISSLLGTFILWYYCGGLPALLGVLNMVWYNAIYTPLKYKTAFAAFPGGVVGAIPPVIGWVAGGQSMLHPVSVALATFFFIGQIPHFWLLILHYSKQYKASGIKSVTDKLNTLQLHRLIVIWVLATAACGSLLFNAIIINNNFSFFVLQAFSLMLMITIIVWFIQRNTGRSYYAFIAINIYYFLVMMVLLIDNFLG